MIWANLVNSFTVTQDYMQKFYLFHNSFSLLNGAIIESIFNSRNILFSGMKTEHLSSDFPFPIPGRRVRVEGQKEQP